MRVARWTRRPIRAAAPRPSVTMGFPRATRTRRRRCPSSSVASWRPTRFRRERPSPSPEGARRRRQRSAPPRALDAVEAEDDDDFERFFAKYRAETEAAAAKGRAMLRGNVPATPETPASEAARRAAAAAALDASPGKTVAAARLAAAAARRETEDFTAARPVSRLARGASARA